MSNRTFIAVIIGLIVVAIIAMLFVSQSGERGVTPETIIKDLSGEVMVSEEEEVVRPVSSPKPESKINIYEACNSALMYMSFTDGESAEAFVAECVEGKHPEVIDRYIESIGIDSAAI